MSVDRTAADRFAEYAHTVLISADAERAVVEQPAAQSLDNHVGVRHASALFTAGHEASRALVAAAAADADAELVETTVTYVNVGFGLITTVAEPCGHVTGGGELEVAVTGTDEKGKTVVTLRDRWRVSPVA